MNFFHYLTMWKVRPTDGKSQICLSDMWILLEMPLAYHRKILGFSLFFLTKEKTMFHTLVFNSWKAWLWPWAWFTDKLSWTPSFSTGLHQQRGQGSQEPGIRQSLAAHACQFHLLLKQIIRKLKIKKGSIFSWASHEVPVEISISREGIPLFTTALVSTHGAVPERS